MSDSDEIPDDAGDAILPVGARLGKYEIVRLLGAGGMGAVYEASHTEIGKRVAIKVLGPSIAAVPGARTRFLREAQLTSKVRHPNIVDVADMGNEAGQAFIVMEFLQGEDLSQRLARTGQMSPVELVEVMLPVCSAVVAAHQAGITHRDLKPQNIFLAAGPHGVQPKVLDFGISKGADKVGVGTLTGTGAMIGTPFYLAPEQIMDGKSAGPASDQYALGVILYECLTGRRPFEADNLFIVFQAIVNGSPPPPRHLRPELAPALEQVVLRAMSVDAKQRYASVKGLGRALLPFASARARLLWNEAFEGADDANQDAFADPSIARAAVSTPPPVRAAGIENRPITGAGAGGTLPLPAELMMAAATPPPGNTTWDVVTPRQQAARRAKKIIGVASGLVAAGLVALWLAGGAEKKGSQGDATAEVPQARTGEPRPSTVKSSSLPSSPSTGGPSARPPAPVPPPPPRPFKVAVAIVPESAVIELDGERVGTGHVERTLPADHRRHVLRATADGFEPRVVEFVDAAPPERIALVSLPVAAPVVRRPTPPRPARRPREPAVERPAPVRSAPSLNPNGAPVID